MKIGDALKEERLKLGISRYEFCQGIIDRSFYTKVENGEGNLGSEALVKLLLKNYIDIEGFFEKIKASYMSKSEYEYENMNKKIEIAYNSGDSKAVKNYMQKMQKESDLWLRANIVLADLDGTIDKLEPIFHVQLNKELNEHDNYVSDIKAFRLLSNSLPLLPLERIDEIVGTAIGKYEGDTLSELEKERLIILYDNYCQACHDRGYKGEWLSHVVNYLIKLNELHFDTYKIAGKFDKALIEGDYNKAKDIKESMEFLGLKDRIKNWNI